MCGNYTFCNSLLRMIFSKPIRLISTKTSKASNDILEEIFTADEKTRILETFNKCTTEELQFTRLLNHQKAIAIVKYRERNGNFSSLPELLRVPGLGITGLQKICNTMKNVDFTSVQKLKKSLELESVKTSPPISEDVCDNLRSLVALEIHADCVGFAHVTRDMTLESWSLLPVFDKPFQRVDHLQFLDKLVQVVQQLPKADIYVLENQIYRYTNLRIVPYLTNLRIMEAMLVTLLNPDLAQTCQHRTFFLKPNLVMKFFNLSVGGERVSCRHIIQEIQRTALPERDPNSPVSNVDVPSMLWGTYWNEKSLGQERLSTCLLLAVAFYKLVVLKTHFLQR